MLVDFETISQVNWSSVRLNKAFDPTELLNPRFAVSQAGDARCKVKISKKRMFPGVTENVMAQ